MFPSENHPGLMLLNSGTRWEEMLSTLALTEVWVFRSQKLIGDRSPTAMINCYYGNLILRYSRNLLGEDSEDPSADRSMLIDSRFLRLATLCRLKLPLLLLRPALPMLPPALLPAVQPPSASPLPLPLLVWFLVLPLLTELQLLLLLGLVRGGFGKYLVVWKL